MEKDLLKLMDLSPADITHILDTADELKALQKQGVAHPYLAGKTLAMIFNKNSTRTRVSFEAGMYQLGGHAIFLSGNESQISRGEAPEDTARVLSRYCDAIMVRTYQQEEVELLAAHASVPVINGLTDFSHPCQVLADLMTIRERKGSLRGLKACYVGDGNNMANSVIVGALKCGMDVSVATPSAYRPSQTVLDYAFSVSTPGALFTLTEDPRVAARNADVIFTDVWASMGWEEEMAFRKAAFHEFQVNEQLLSLANPGCMLQHCLPAHKGEEISAEAFEAHADEIFDEAENRLHVQKAILYLLMK